MLHPVLCNIQLKDLLVPVPDAISYEKNIALHVSQYHRESKAMVKSVNHTLRLINKCTKNGKGQPEALMRGDQTLVSERGTWPAKIRCCGNEITATSLYKTTIGHIE